MLTHLMHLSFFGLIACECIHVRTYVRTYLRTYVCMYSYMSCVCIHVCMHVCTYARMHVCTYARMHVCTYARMHVCTMHACMYARIYARMNVHASVYTYENSYSHQFLKACYHDENDCRTPQEVFRYALISETHGNHATLQWESDYTCRPMAYDLWVA